MSDIKRCHKVNCFCTHTEPCEYGWINIRYKEIKTVKRNGETKEIVTWYDGATFCPTCDAQRAHIQTTSTTSEELGQRLRARSEFKTVENYDNQEASKTRTL